jgi:hypothetical protein
MDFFKRRKSLKAPLRPPNDSRFFPKRKKVATGAESTISTPEPKRQRQVLAVNKQSPVPSEPATRAANGSSSSASDPFEKYFGKCLAPPVKMKSSVPEHTVPASSVEHPFVKFMSSEKTKLKFVDAHGRLSGSHTLLRERLPRSEDLSVWDETVPLPLPGDLPVSAPSTSMCLFTPVHDEVLLHTLSGEVEAAVDKHFKGQLQINMRNALFNMLSNFIPGGQAYIKKHKLKLRRKKKDKEPMTVEPTIIDQLLDVWAHQLFIGQWLVVNQGLAVRNAVDIDKVLMKGKLRDALNDGSFWGILAYIGAKCMSRGLN